MFEAMFTLLSRAINIESEQRPTIPYKPKNTDGGANTSTKARVVSPAPSKSPEGATNSDHRPGSP